MISNALRPSRTRTAAVLIVLIAVIAALHFAARFDLQGPGDLTSEGIADWMNDPVAAMATVARWVSLVLAYYLAVVVAAAAFLGECLEESSWGRFTPSVMTGLVGLLLGTTAVVLPAAAHIGSSSVSPAVEPLVLEEIHTPLTLVEVPAAEPDAALESLVAVPDVSVPTPVDTASIDDVWTVQSGDSFWSIAEETLADERADAELTDEEIAVYWRALIAANEDELVEPGNPDLIFPGQVLVLPPV